MLPYESFASIMGIKRSTDGPTVIFVGIRMPEPTVRDLYRFYGVRSVIVGPSDLITMNSNYASVFIFTYPSISDQNSFKELWRVAKEGSAVFVLDGVKNGVGEKKRGLTNPTEYGFEFYTGGLQSCWPYSQGIIRKDLAKHFRS